MISYLKVNCTNMENLAAVVPCGFSGFMLVEHKNIGSENNVNIGDKTMKANLNDQEKRFGSPFYGFNENCSTY